MSDTIQPLHLKAAFATLGCKLNFAETSSLRDTLAREGIRPAEKGERADVCIIMIGARIEPTETWDTSLGEKRAAATYEARKGE